MPKITYEEPKQLNVNYPKKRSGGFWKIFLIVLISLLVGCIGGVGSIIVLSHDGGAIAKKLGFSIEEYGTFQMGLNSIAVLVNHR